MFKLKIAISSCLAGNRVRYDGRDKFSSVYQVLLERGVEFITICPEVGIGMPVPRPPIQLVEVGAETRVKMVADDSKDYTDNLLEFSESQLELLGNCDGYITAQRSPSCGFQSTNLFNSDKDIISNQISGLFIDRVHEALPELPICDEEKLVEAGQLESFLERVMAYRNNKKGL